MANWSKIGQDSKWQGYHEIFNILKHINGVNLNST